MKIALHRSVRRSLLDINDRIGTLNTSNEASLIHIITKKTLAKSNAALMMSIKSLGFIKEPGSRCRAGSYSGLQRRWREIWSELRWPERGVCHSLLRASNLNVVVWLARCKGLGNRLDNLDASNAVFPAKAEICQAWNFPYSAGSDSLRCTGILLYGRNPRIDLAIMQESETVVHLYAGLA